MSFQQREKQPASKRMRDEWTLQGLVKDWKGFSMVSDCLRQSWEQAGTNVVLVHYACVHSHLRKPKSGPIRKDWAAFQYTRGSSDNRIAAEPMLFQGHLWCMKKIAKGTKVRLAPSETPMPFTLSLAIVSGLVALLIAWFSGGS